MKEGSQLLREEKRIKSKIWYDDECKQAVTKRERVRMSPITPYIIPQKIENNTKSAERM